MATLHRRDTATKTVCGRPIKAGTRTTLAWPMTTCKSCQRWYLANTNVRVPESWRRNPGKAAPTTMQRQYAALKRQRPDVLLFMLSGGSYKAFGKDATTARRAIHRASLPLATADRYARQLNALGYTVALAKPV